MSKVKLQRIPFTTSADIQLRSLKARTGITPNILCRLGFCLSLEEPGIPKILPKNAEIGREINRYTLLGEHDLSYVSLLTTWIKKNQSEDLNGEIDEFFVAHMNRGVEILSARLKTLSDIAALI